MDYADLPPIALVQMHVVPGRPDRNVERMLARADDARRRGAEIVVFSEMCVPGYIIGDQWEVDALALDYAAWSEPLVEASTELAIVFGNVVVDRGAIGEDGRARRYNAVHVCAGGRRVERDVPPGLPAGVHPKTLHPDYRFFDDDRYFYSLRKLAAEQGRPLEDWLVPFPVPLRDGRTLRLGVQLCEDIWCQDYARDGEVLDTLRTYHRAGADLVVNLSASPWTWAKNDKRNRTVREVLERSPVPFLYVNHVGAQNNGKNVVVFDGDTTAYDATGTIRARAAPWREAVLVVPGDDAVAAVPTEIESIHDAIVAGLRHFDELRGGASRFLIGASGGVDSSVVACMLVQAFGPDRVFAVNMPTRFNAALTRDNAAHLAGALGIDYQVVPIEDHYVRLAETVRAAGFPRAPGEYTRLVDENVQARIRGADVLAGIAAKCGLVFSNNGNKTEVALGYATLYGDVNGAVAPIGDLYKTQVFALARHLNEAVHGREVVPWNLIDGSTVPSAELSEAQDVTRGLGDPIKYGYHDALLRQMIEYRRHPLDILGWALDGALPDRLEWGDEAALREHFPSARDWVEDLEWVARQLRINVFKRIQAPPIIVLSKRAFGFDLRESQLPDYEPRGYAALREQVINEAW